MRIRSSFNQGTIIRPLAIILVLLLAGCDDDYPISEGLLGGSGDNDEEQEEGEGIAPAAIPQYETLYEGPTETAVVSNGEEARRLTDTAYLVWHLATAKRGIDALVAELARIADDNVSSDPYQSSTPWNRGFNALNCGSTDDFNLEEEGASGRASMDGFCVRNAPRTDGGRLEITGSFSWENARIVDVGPDREDATRRVSFEDLNVTWRGETYVLNGATRVEEGSNTIHWGIDITDEARDTSYRFVGQRRAPAGGDNDEFVFHPDSGGIQLTRGSNPNWVTGSTSCPEDEQASSGNARLFEEDNDTDYRMQLAACDQYNLDGVDADDNSLPAGPFTLLEQL